MKFSTTYRCFIQTLIDKYDNLKPFLTTFKFIVNGRYVDYPKLTAFQKECINNLVQRKLEALEMINKENMENRAIQLPCTFKSMQVVADVLYLMFNLKWLMPINGKTIDNVIELILKKIFPKNQIVMKLIKWRAFRESKNLHRLVKIGEKLAYDIDNEMYK